MAVRNFLNKAARNGTKSAFSEVGRREIKKDSTRI